MKSKFTSIVTSICFLFNFVCAQPMSAALQMKRESREFRQLLDEFVLPSTVGKVTAARALGSDKVVINIQDLHCHPEVQRNISRILELLDEKYTLKNIHVEGAYGAIDGGWLEDIKDGELKKDIIETLVDEGRLSGSEYFALTRDKVALLKGLEDEGIYKANILRLNRILDKKEHFAGKTEELKKDLSVMRSKYLNRKNRHFNDIIDGYRSGRISTAKFYTLLGKYVENINTHPERYNSLFTIDREKYRNIWNYLDLVEKGRHLEYKNISRQMSGFMLVLKQKLPYKAYNFLLNRTDNFSRLDELHLYLSKICREYNLDITANYPDLKYFFDYMDSSEAVNPILLLKEERRLVEEIRIGLSQDISELEVSFAVDFFGSFEDYLNNRLTSGDYDYFRERFDEFKNVWAKYVCKNRLPDLAGDFALLDEYYKVNNERNDHFLKNMLGDYHNDAKQDTVAGKEDSLACSARVMEKGREIMVVITGGYHTEGLERMLEERGITYLQITPNVTQDTRRSGEIYIELARQQAKILSNALAPVLYLLKPASMQKLEAAIFEAGKGLEGRELTRSLISDSFARTAGRLGIDTDVEVVQGKNRDHWIVLQKYKYVTADGLGRTITVKHTVRKEKGKIVSSDIAIEGEHTGAAAAAGPMAAGEIRQDITRLMRELFGDSIQTLLHMDIDMFISDVIREFFRGQGDGPSYQYTRSSYYGQPVAGISEAEFVGLPGWAQNLLLRIHAKNKDLRAAAESNDVLKVLYAASLLNSVLSSVNRQDGMGTAEEAGPGTATLRSSRWLERVFRLLKLWDSLSAGTQAGIQSFDEQYMAPILELHRFAGLLTLYMKDKAAYGQEVKRFYEEHGYEPDDINGFNYFEKGLSEIIETSSFPMVNIFGFSVPGLRTIALLITGHSRYNREARIAGKPVMTQDGHNSPRDDMPFETKSNHYGVKILQAIGRNGLEQIAYNLGLKADDISSIHVERLRANQKEIYAVTITSAEGLKNKFIIYAPNYVNSVIDEKDNLRSLSVSEKVVQFGGQFEINVDEKKITVVAAEYLEGVTVRELIETGELDDGMIETIEKQAVQAFFDSWIKSGSFISDVSRNQLTVTVTDRDFLDTLKGKDKKEKARLIAGAIKNGRLQYSVKIHDVGFVRKASRPGEILSYFIGVFQEPVGGMEGSHWCWSKRKASKGLSGKEGFFDAIIEIMGEEKGLKFLRSAQTDLEKYDISGKDRILPPLIHYLEKRSLAEGTAPRAPQKNGGTKNAPRSSKDEKKGFSDGKLEPAKMPPSTIIDGKNNVPGLETLMSFNSNVRAPQADLAAFSDLARVIPYLSAIEREELRARDVLSVFTRIKPGMTNLDGGYSISGRLLYPGRIKNIIDAYAKVTGSSDFAFVHFGKEGCILYSRSMLRSRVFELQDDLYELGLIPAKYGSKEEISDEEIENWVKRANIADREVPAWESNMRLGIILGFPYEDVLRFSADRKYDYQRLSALMKKPAMIELMAKKEIPFNSRHGFGWFSVRKDTQAEVDRWDLLIDAGLSILNSYERRKPVINKIYDLALLSFVAQIESLINTPSQILLTGMLIKGLREDRADGTDAARSVEKGEPPAAPEEKPVGLVEDIVPRNEFSPVFINITNGAPVERKPYEKKEEVMLNEAGVADSGILTTRGLVVCTGVFLYDKKRKVGALVHIQPYCLRNDVTGKQLREPGQHEPGEIERVLRRMELNGAARGDIECFYFGSALDVETIDSETGEWIKTSPEDWNKYYIRYLTGLNIPVRMLPSHNGRVDEIRFNIDTGEAKILIVSYDSTGQYETLIEPGFTVSENDKNSMIGTAAEASDWIDLAVEAWLNTPLDMPETEALENLVFSKFFKATRPERTTDIIETLALNAGRLADGAAEKEVIAPLVALVCTQENYREAHERALWDNRSSDKEHPFSSVVITLHPRGKLANDPVNAGFRVQMPGVKEGVPVWLGIDNGVIVIYLDISEADADMLNFGAAQVLRALDASEEVRGNELLAEKLNNLSKGLLPDGVRAGTVPSVIVDYTGQARNNPGYRMLLADPLVIRHTEARSYEELKAEDDAARYAIAPETIFVSHAKNRQEISADFSASARLGNESIFIDGSLSGQKNVHDVVVEAHNAGKRVYSAYAYNQRNARKDIDELAAKGIDGLVIDLTAKSDAAEVQAILDNLAAVKADCVLIVDLHGDVRDSVTVKGQVKLIKTVSLRQNRISIQAEVRNLKPHEVARFTDVSRAPLDSLITAMVSMPVTNASMIDIDQMREALNQDRDIKERVELAEFLMKIARDRIGLIKTPEQKAAYERRVAYELKWNCLPEKDGIGIPLQKVLEALGGTIDRSVLTELIGVFGSGTAVGIHLEKLRNENDDVIGQAAAAFLRGIAERMLVKQDNGLELANRHYEKLAGEQRYERARNRALNTAFEQAELEGTEVGRWVEKARSAVGTDLAAVSLDESINRIRDAYRYAATDEEKAIAMKGLEELLGLCDRRLKNTVNDEIKPFDPRQSAIMLTNA